MATAATDGAEVALLNFLFRSGALAKQANWYCGLFTTDPTDAGTGTEVGGGGYGRIAIPVIDASWSAPTTSGGLMRITNSGPVQFATPTSDWGTPLYWGLWTAATGGALWIYGPINGTPRPILTNDPAISLPTGSLEITIGQSYDDYLRTAILNHLFRTATLTKASNLYLAYHTADPKTGGAEVIGGNYARTAIAVVDGSWTAPADSGTDKQISNLTSIQAPQPTASWGTYTHVALYDALTAGNRWLSQAVGAAQLVASTDNPPVIAVGAFTIGQG